MPPIVSLTVLGSLPRKSNSRRIVTFGKRPALIKSRAALDYEQSFLWQIPDDAKVGYAGDVALKARIFYSSRRPDLSDELLCDLIEKASIIVNDRQIKIKCLHWDLDRHNPRVEFEIYKLEEWRCEDAIE